MLYALKHQLNEVDGKIDRLLQNDRSIIHNEGVIMSQLTDSLDRAEAAAAANSQADDAAEKLLVSISQMLKDALASGGDQAAIIDRVNAIADGINSRSAQLGNAVAANTPAAGTDAPVTSPTPA